MLNLNKLTKDLNFENIDEVLGGCGHGGRRRRGRRHHGGCGSSSSSSSHGGDCDGTGDDDPVNGGSGDVLPNSNGNSGD